MNIQCSGGSRNFAKDTGALKMRDSGAGHRRLAMINWEDHWRWSSCNYSRSCKERNLNHSTVIQHLNQTRKLKKLKWVLHELTEKKKKKNHHFEVFSSVAQSCLTPWPHGLQHTRPPCPSPTPRVYSNSCPLSWWCHPTISSSVIPFSSRLQSFPESGSLMMSQLFASGGQSIGVSGSASFLPTTCSLP